MELAQDRLQPFNIDMLICCNNLNKENPLATSYCSFCGAVDFALRVPDDVLDWRQVKKHRNRLFAKELIAYADEYGIPVTDEERQAAA